MIFSLGVTIEPFISTDLDVHPERHINRIKVFTHCTCSRYFNRRRPAGFFTDVYKRQDYSKGIRSAGCLPAWYFFGVFDTFLLVLGFIVYRF